MTQLPSWRPMHLNHAVQVATVAVHFAQPITDIPWNNVVREAREKSRKLGLVTENKATLLSVEDVGTPPKQSEVYEFYKFREPTFFEEKFVVLRNSIQFESWAYTRWNGLASRAFSLIESVIAHYLSAVEVRNFTIQYINRFDGIRGEKSASSELLKQGSSVIASRSFADFGPWHSHAGWRAGKTDISQVIANIDIDVAEATQVEDGEISKFVQIRAALSENFQQGSKILLNNRDVDIKFVRDKFDILHRDVKVIIEDALNTRAVEAISLKLGQN